METIKQSSREVRPGWGGDLLYAVVLVLVALSAFGLGRISTYPLPAPVGISTAGTTTRVSLSEGGLYVASQGSGVYYGPWCGQVKNIAPAKKLWFRFAEEARSAGYKPGACKGTE